MLANKDSNSSTIQSIHKLNSYHYGHIINLLRFLVVFLALSLGGLSSFLGYLVFKQNRSDLVYFATLEGTHLGIRKDNPNNSTRESFEVENFSIRFLQDGFSHSENNYQENIERALTVMNNRSRVTLKNFFLMIVCFKYIRNLMGSLLFILKAYVPISKTILIKHSSTFKQI